MLCSGAVWGCMEAAQLAAGREDELAEAAEVAARGPEGSRSARAGVAQRRGRQVLGLPLGLMALKGVSQPVQVVRCVWQPPALEQQQQEAADTTEEGEEEEEEVGPRPQLRQRWQALAREDATGEREEGGSVLGSGLGLGLGLRLRP